MDELPICKNAKALLELDASGSLVPHGIGGLARDIITRQSETIERLTREREQCKLAKVHELILATSALIALFPADIDERKAAIIRRARDAVSTLDQETSAPE
jgi:hypothetical protein